MDFPDDLTRHQDPVSRDIVITRKSEKHRRPLVVRRSRFDHANTLEEAEQIIRAEIMAWLEGPDDREPPAPPVEPPPPPPTTTKRLPLINRAFTDPFSPAPPTAPEQQPKRLPLRSHEDARAMPAAVDEDETGLEEGF
jgi:hypothetical protein